jgi:predicted metal-dependent hydrolase
MDRHAMKSREKLEKFERGLEHFNARQFFEAHEVWEEVWLVEDEPEKTFLQGIIQIAAAFHHYRRGNTDGAETLLAAGIVKISRFPAQHRGLAIHELRDEAKFWARALGDLQRPGDDKLPAIRRSDRRAPPKTAELGAETHRAKN